MTPILTRLIRRDSQQRLWFLAAVSGLLFTLATMPVAAQTPAPEETAPATEDVSAPPTAEEPPAFSRQERDDQLLAAATPEEVRWLGEPEEKILALFRPTETRETKGALLILHATDVPPGWPVSFENLRRNLPQYGWVTLALTLPPREQASVPKREIPESLPTEAPDTTTETEPPAPEITTAPPEPSTTRAEIIANRVATAAAFLKEQGQLNVVLLIDNSSILDTLAGLTAGSHTIQALLLANLQPQEQLTRTQLESIFSSAKLPVMDIFVVPNNPQQQTIRQQHRAAAQRNKLEQYHQLSLPLLANADVDNARSFWLERVRGFIEQHAQGREITKDQEKR